METTNPISTLSRPARLAVWVAIPLVVWALAAAILPNGAPIGIVLIGSIIGSSTGLAAVGIILVWRANRVVNFAAGGLGGAAGLNSVLLFVNWGWPYPVVFVMAIVSGVTIGALVEILIIRRFTNAARLVLTVATIGLAQVLGGVELLLARVLYGSESPVVPSFGTPLTEIKFDVGPVVITGDHLLVLAVVPIVVAGLAWFLKRSLAGTAIRAAAENTDRARLLGIPVRNLTTLVWAIAGGLAALTLALQAPFSGATASALAGPAVMLTALAAAVVARMESMPKAFVAAVAIGILDQLVRWNTSSPELVDVVIFAVIIGALLTHRSRSRAHDADGGWRDAEFVGSLAPAINKLKEIQIAKIAGVVLLIAAAVVVPLMVKPGLAMTLSVMAIWGIVAVSLVVLTGWAGQISLGQFAFVGVGAIAAGNLISRWNVDLFVSLAVAAAAGAVAALLLGVPALKIRGPFLAIVTLSFAVVLDGYVLNPNVFPALIPQDVPGPSIWGRIDLNEQRNMLWLCLAVLALSIVLARGVRRSRSGRLLIASRDNSKATEAASVSTRYATLSGFVFAGTLAGLAGGLHVILLHGARVGSYQPVQSVEIFSMATIGGLGSIGGAITGAAGMRGLQDLDATIRLVGAGAGVLLVLWLAPSGLAGLAAMVRDRIVARIAARHGMDIKGEPLTLTTATAPSTPPAPVSVAIDTDVTSTVDLADQDRPWLSETVTPPPYTGPAENQGPDALPPMTEEVSPAEFDLVEKYVNNHGLFDEPSSADPVVAEASGTSTPAAAELGGALGRQGTNEHALGLSATGVNVSYGRLQVLFDLDLQVSDREMVALLGTNGAGKSTVLKAICGLVPHNGKVMLGETDISRMSTEQIVREGLALMPGGKAIFPTLSVADHLRLSTWIFRKDHDRIEADLAEIHRMFPILEERSSQLAGDLSGGEQQQLALAMTLMLRPKVMFIDELSLGLAPMIVGQLCEVVRNLNGDGTTIVVVEQSVNVALTLAERAVFLEKGRSRFEGPTQELLDRPDILRSVFIAGADSHSDDGSSAGASTTSAPSAESEESADAIRAIDLSSLSRNRDHLDTHRPVHPLVGVNGHTVPGSDAGPAPSDQPTPVLACHGITKRFGGVNALSDVSLEVMPGEIVGLIGQNGAGKTTLMDCISGFHTIDGGFVTFRGVDITDWEPFERARGRLGRSFQDARLFPSLTVLETIAVANEQSAECRSLIADATRQPASYISEDAVVERAKEIISLLGLTTYANTPTGALSTGTRRIVELACLLAQDPVLMCLDEPSAGVAQKETEALGPLLRQICEHTGAALLIIEHDMPLLSGLCDRLVALELGSVISSGAPDQVLEDPAVVASYLGTDEAAINRSGVTASA